MAAKGTEAKNKIIAKLKESFGQNFLGEYDKKYYIQEEENVEMVQIAVALTCPKVAVDFGETTVSSEPNTSFSGAAPFEPDMTPAEEKNLETLLSRLGL